MDEPHKSKEPTDSICNLCKRAKCCNSTDGTFSCVIGRSGGELFWSQLYGFLDFAATQAACADSNAFGLAVNQCPYRLEVGFKDPLRLVIGMTDVMAGLAAFAAKITCKCHRDTPSSNRMDTTLKGLGMYHRVIRHDKQV